MSVKLWRYAEPNTDKFEGWYVAHLDSNGFFAVASDYGDYVYHWPPRGQVSGSDFRRFVITCDDDYIARKIGGSHRSVFDGDETAKEVRRHILRWRRDGSYTKEEAREHWDLVPSAFDDEYEWRDWLWQTRIDDAHDFHSTTMDPQLRGFLVRVLPRLRAKIAEDLVREQATEAA